MADSIIREIAIVVKRLLAPKPKESSPDGPWWQKEDRDPPVSGTKSGK